MTVKKYGFLKDFVEDRLFAVLILDEINSNVSNPKESIQPDAVRMEKDKMHKTLSKIRSDGAKVRRANFLAEHSTLHCKYTLVAHPVGMHKDSFGTYSIFDEKLKKKKRLPNFSLENKTCFIWHSACPGDIGRGGQGGSRFVWALLDWTKE